MAKRKAGGRPRKSTNEVLKVDGLQGDWDANDEIRERLRKGKCFMDEGKGEVDIPASVANTAVLQPLLTRMSLTEIRPLPPVEDLRDQVEALYLKNKRGETPEDVPNIVALAWRIRKLLGFIKMKCRRGEVSSVPFWQEIFDRVLNAVQFKYVQFFFLRTMFSSTRGQSYFLGGVNFM